MSGTAGQRDGWLRRAEGVPTGTCSILIPTLNSAPRLDDVLAAVCASSHEIIVCDGGSTDTTLSITDAYGPRIRVVKSGMGFATQLAAGVRIASHPLVLTLGADVLISSDSLRELIEEHGGRSHRVLQARRRAVATGGLGSRTSSFILETTFSGRRAVVIVSGCVLHPRELLRQALALAADCDAFDFDTCLAIAYDELGATRILSERVYVKEFTVKSVIGLARQHVNYGIGDHHFYARNRDVWSVSRRLRSLFHPFRRYLIDLGLPALRRGRLDLLSGLAVCAIARYSGWLRARIARTETRSHWS